MTDRIAKITGLVMKKLEGEAEATLDVIIEATVAACDACPVVRVSMPAVARGGGAAGASTGSGSSGKPAALHMKLAHLCGSLKKNPEWRELADGVGEVTLDVSRLKAETATAKAINSSSELQGLMTTYPSIVLALEALIEAKLSNLGAGALVAASLGDEQKANVKSWIYGEGGAPASGGAGSVARAPASGGGGAATTGSSSKKKGCNDIKGACAMSNKSTTEDGLACKAGLLRLMDADKASNGLKAGIELWSQLGKDAKYAPLIAAWNALCLPPLTEKAARDAHAPQTLALLRQTVEALRGDSSAPPVEEEVEVEEEAGVEEPPVATPPVVAAPPAAAVAAPKKFARRT